MLETDYLIVGCGASGMAFADVILTETDAEIIMVDRFHKPGGHWNLAYPFVRLHQPSSYYGVSSADLGNREIDQVGLNRGLQHLSSSDQILAYYDEIMQRKFLPSGRVKYFPLCNYLGNTQFVSNLTGKTYDVKVKRKLVNAIHMQTKVPSTHVPNFTVSPGVHFMPINNLPQIEVPPVGVVVIGGGKTGVDAILWLLENGIEPEKISWVISRDAWFIDRRNTQPSMEFLGDFLHYQASQYEALRDASSIPDLFDRLEEAGVVLRIDPTVKPTMFRGATVSRLELDELRRVKNVIRMGRVRHIDESSILFEEGSLDVEPGQIFVDCSANALSHSEITDVFSGRTITIQPIRGGQIVFSAALIAHIEAAYSDEAHKNELSRVVPLPDHDTDWIKMLAGSLRNQQIWRKDSLLIKWIRQNRLDGFGNLLANVGEGDTDLKMKRTRVHKSIGPALEKLQAFVSELS